MKNPAQFFQAQFFQSLHAFGLFFLALCFLSILRPQVLYGLGFEELPHYSWSQFQNMLISAGFGSLIALIFPWVSFHHLKEWLYTRSLSQNQVFSLAFGIFLRYWLGLGVVLALLTWGSQVFYHTSGYSLDWEIYLAFMLGSLYFALLMVSQGQVLFWQLLPVMIWLGLLVFQTFLSFGSLSFWLNWGLIVSSPLWAYLMLKWQPQLNWLNFSSHWFYLTFGVFEWQTLHSPNPWKQRITLLVAPLRISYSLLLLLICLVFILPSSLFLLRESEILPEMFYGFFFTFFVLGLVFLAFVSPRWLLKPYREFFHTRPLTPIQLYFWNWILQGMGLFILGIFALIQLFTWAQIQASDTWPNFQLCILLGLLIWFGGELLGGLVLLVLGLSLSLAPWTGLLVLLNTPNTLFWALCLGVLSYRILDFWLYQQETLDTPWISRVSLRYVLPGALLGSLVILGFSQHPLLNFILFKSSIARFEGERNLLLAQIQDWLFLAKPLQNPSLLDSHQEAFISQSLLRQILDDPSSGQASLNLGLSLVTKSSPYSRQTYGYFPNFTRPEYFHLPYAQGYLILPDNLDIRSRNYRIQLGNYWLTQAETAPLAERLRLSSLISEAAGDPSLALNQASQALKASQTEAQAFANAYTLGRLQRHNFLYRQAHETYQTLQKKYPQLKLQALLLQAATALEQGEPHQALAKYVDSYQIVLTQDASSRRTFLPWVRSELFQLLRTTGIACEENERLGQVLQPVVQILLKNKRQHNGICFYGQKTPAFTQLIQEKNYPQALALLQTKSKDRPWAWQAFLLEKTGQHQAAKALANQALHAHYESESYLDLPLRTNLALSLWPAYATLIAQGDLQEINLWAYLLHHPNSELPEIATAISSKNQLALQDLKRALDQLYTFYQNRGGMTEKRARSFELTRVLVHLTQYLQAELPADLKAELPQVQKAVSAVMLSRK